VERQDRARSIAVVWDEGPNAKISSSDIAEVLKAGLDADQAFVGTRRAAT